MKLFNRKKKAVEKKASWHLSPEWLSRMVMDLNKRVIELENKLNEVKE